MGSLEKDRYDGSSISVLDMMGFRVVKTYLGVLWLRNEQDVGSTKNMEHKEDAIIKRNTV